jgi:hypothetical protein
MASNIANRANALNSVNGKSPISTMLYLDISKTLKDISDVSGVAENTIKQTYNIMQAKQSELISDAYKASSNLKLKIN